MIKKLACFIGVFLCGLCHAHTQTTEIRCSIDGINEAYLVWGVNDWQAYTKKLPQTVMVDKVMRTAMKKEGDEYVARIAIDSGYTVNYGFMFLKKAGPFGRKAEYWDMAGGKGYSVQSAAGAATITLDMSQLQMLGQVALNRFGALLLAIFGAGALLIYSLRRYYYKSSAATDKKMAWFAGITAALFITLFLIRAYIAGLLYEFIVDPLPSLWQMCGAASDDMKYATILLLFFGLLFWFFKKAGRFILVAYAIVVFISIVAALANIRVLMLLGRPFNYQWLYYSDFLQSRDASLAMAANVTWPFVSGFLLMLAAGAAMVFFFCEAYLQKQATVKTLFVLLLVATLSAQFNSLVPPLKAANPVLFFIRSINDGDASGIADKSYAGKSDFDKKNIERLQPEYKNKFEQAKIKNVVFVVLESTPWEYVQPYDTVYKATPFLDSCKNSAAIFNNIYAHIPATNKSMFSFLCASYPEISFKTLTAENPDISYESIPSELGKHGYRSAFFNSGDNSYQNAGRFLKSRGFDRVKDFHTNDCNKAIFSDSRYSQEKLDGVDDSCLSVRFLKWIGQDTVQPFFAMMWTFQTHYPYFVAGPQKNYRTGNPSLEKYLNALNRADETIGQIVKGLEQRGLLNQTLIVVSGDHGEAFGRHNQTTHGAAIYEENVHVPLLLINPQLFKGERVESLGGISDIGPTIFSVLGKRAPAQWQGENLFSNNRRQRVYFFNPYSDYLFGMREGNYKFIYNATRDSYQLYDLAKDPQETKDISKENEAYVQKASGHVRAWMYYQANHMDIIANSKPVK